MSAVMRRRRKSTTTAAPTVELVNRPVSVADFRHLDGLAMSSSPGINIITPTRKSDRQSICFTGGFLALSPPVNGNNNNNGTHSTAAFGGSYLSLTSPIRRYRSTSSSSKAKNRRPHSYACDGQPFSNSCNGGAGGEPRQRPTSGAGLYSIREEDGNNNNHNNVSSPTSSSTTSSWSSL